jgi:hypothetical protein
MQQLEPRQNAAATKIPEEPKIHAYFCNPCFFQKKNLTQLAQLSKYATSIFFSICVYEIFRGVHG